LSAEGGVERHAAIDDEACSGDDGAMQMNGMAELVTLTKYWERWSDPRLIVMVSNNRDLAFVTWEERIQAGDPKWESSQSLPDVRYADFARSIGLGGLRIETPDEIGPAWDQALSARLGAMVVVNHPPRLGSGEKAAAVVSHATS
jgi:thiamine pyrophosphate-dependent acetolactate synthase large subunit-like protein